MRDKNCTIISADAEKPLEKTHHHSTIKTLSKSCMEGTYLNIIKAIYGKHIANTILNHETLKTFPLRLRTRPGCLLSLQLFTIYLEVLTMTIREKKRKIIQIEKEEAKLSLFEDDNT